MKSSKSRILVITALLVSSASFAVANSYPGSQLPPMPPPPAVASVYPGSQLPPMPPPPAVAGAYPGSQLPPMPPPPAIA